MALSFTVVFCLTVVWRPFQHFGCVPEKLVQFQSKRWERAHHWKGSRGAHTKCVFVRVECSTECGGWRLDSWRGRVPIPLTTPWLSSVHLSLWALDKNRTANPQLQSTSEDESTGMPRRCSMPACSHGSAQASLSTCHLQSKSDTLTSGESSRRLFHSTNALQQTWQRSHSCSSLGKKDQISRNEIQTREAQQPKRCNTHYTLEIHKTSYLLNVDLVKLQQTCRRSNWNPHAALLWGFLTRDSSFSIRLCILGNRRWEITCQVRRLSHSFTLH